MKDLLKKLADAQGVSGFEDEVRNIIIDELKDHVDSVDVDELGNVITTRNGKADGKKIMLAAHMDEIGLMVRYIDKKGVYQIFQNRWNKRSNAFKPRSNYTHF